MTLAWSILMLSLVMYMFGICFLMIITGHLSDTPASGVPVETMDSIRMYWGSVWQSIVTLYYAVTGGADWEPLAQPIRDCGELYYVIFLFYIAFTAIAVLNVLTGLYVETATKISEHDDEVVHGELAHRPETLEFREFLQQLDKDSGTGSGETVRLSRLERRWTAAPVQAYMKAIEVTPDDIRRIYKLLDLSETGTLQIEELIDGTLRCGSAALALDVMVLLSDSKRCMRQQDQIMHDLREISGDIRNFLEATRDRARTCQRHSSTARRSSHTPRNESLAAKVAVPTAVQ